MYLIFLNCPLKYINVNDIRHMLQEISDEEIDDCRELESDNDLSVENIESNIFSSYSEQNISDEELEELYINKLYHIVKDKDNKCEKLSLPVSSKRKK